MRAAATVVTSLAGRSQPFRLPEQQATGLALTVRGAVASQILQVHCAPNPPASGLMDRVAGLVRNGRDFKLLATVLQHLRHEWHGLEFARPIQRGEDLLAVTHCHPITHTELHARYPLFAPYPTRPIALRSPL